MTIIIAIVTSRIRSTVPIVTAVKSHKNKNENNNNNKNFNSNKTISIIMTSTVVTRIITNNSNQNHKNNS